MSAKRSRSSTPTRSPAGPLAPPVARADRHVLRSSTVGALPILNQFLRRMRLEEFLRAALPPEDHRTKLSPVKSLLVLLRNLLVSRAPIYGVGEWTAQHAADVLGLTAEEIGRLNDDHVGRALDRLFPADVPSLVLADGATGDRPVRDRAVAHAGTTAATPGSSRHGIDTAATQTPQADWPTG